MSNDTNIFQNTDCLSQEQLLRYVKGKMTKDEMRIVELHIADCEICFDTVEGLSLTEKSQLENIQVELQQRIHQKLQTEEKQRVIPFYKKWYSAAAAIALLFLVSVYIVKKYGEQDNTGLAENKIETETKVSSVEPAKQITNERFQSDTITTQLQVQEEKQKAKQTFTINPTVSGSVASTDKKPDIIDEVRRQNADLESDKTVPENTNQEGLAVADDYRKADSVVSKANMTSIKDADVVAQNKSVQLEESKLDAKYKNEAFKVSEKKTRESVAPAAAPATSTSTFSSGDKNNSSSNFDYQLYDSGLNYFNAKDYNNALNSFNRVLAKQPDNINSNYYAGVSNYNLGNYTVAVQQLNIVANYKKNSFYESALWYKGNALLKLNNKKEAKKIFESIVKLKGNYKKQAEDLLKDL